MAEPTDDFLDDMAALGEARVEANDERPHPAIRASSAAAAEKIAAKYGR